MKTLKIFIDSLVQKWPTMSTEQKNKFCAALESGNILKLMTILKEVDNEDKAN